jgi:hypothetical protein
VHSSRTTTTRWAPGLRGISLGTSPQAAADHIFTRGFQVQAAGVVDTARASDHFPMLLPVLAVVVFFVGAFMLEVLVAGLDFTLAALARNLGLAR